MKPNALVPELYCTDLEKTLAFYLGILGFEILYQREAEKFVYLQKGRAQIMVEQLDVGHKWITAPLEPPFGRGVNFQIETNSVDVLYEKVLESGTKPFLPIEEKWYEILGAAVGHRRFIVQDPDGYLLRFYGKIEIPAA